MQRSEKKWSLWAKPIIGAKLVEDRRQKNILGKKFYFSRFLTQGLTKLFKTSNRSRQQKWTQELIRIQAFLDFLNFQFYSVYNSILFSSPLVLLNNLNLQGFCFHGFCVSPHCINSVNQGMPVQRQIKCSLAFDRTRKP